MSRRPGIIVLGVALFLIVLLNGAWFYSYHDEQPPQTALADNGPPPPPSPPHAPVPDATNDRKGGVVPQPEKAPQLDLEKEKQEFNNQGTKEPQKEAEIVKATTTAHGPKVTSTILPTVDELVGDKIDWSQFAYVQYVTATEHVCNSVMVFESLHRLGSKADRVLLYPSEWGPVDGPKWKALESTATKIMAQARDKYHVKLTPVQLIRERGLEPTWESGFTKLLAFNQTTYARTIMFDNDATVLKSLDHLFLLPPTPLAIPRAYWLAPDSPPEKTIQPIKLSAQLLVVTPDPVVFAAMQDAIKHKGSNDYDMEIINFVLGPVAMVLPHRALNLLSGEFRREHKPEHTGYDRYLGITGERWDAKKVLAEAYYVHFSDWPRPKPWYLPHEDKLPELMPKCYPKTPKARVRRGEDMDCSDKETWLWLYSDFKDRRKAICGLDLMQPPTWRG